MLKWHSGSDDYDEAIFEELKEIENQIKAEYHSF